MNYNLLIKTNSKFQDIEGLIDYDEIDKQNFKIRIKESCFFMKDEDRLYQLKQMAELNSMNEKFIAKIVPGNDCFHVKMNNNLENTLQNSEDSGINYLWMVIRKTFFKDDRGYQLKIGDSIKMGKIIFKVKDFKTDNNENKDLLSQFKNSKAHNSSNSELSQFYHSNFPLNNYPNNRIGMLFGSAGKESSLNIHNYKMKNSKEEKFSNKLITQVAQENPKYKTSNGLPNEIKRTKSQSEVCCRICLSEEYSQEDPLITPCKCSGTMKYIHLSCIKSYFKSKITTQFNECVTVYSYNSFDCDLCKVHIPQKIKIIDKTYYLTDIRIPENNYLILNTFITKDSTKTYFQYIINFNTKTSLKLGRSADMDVIISDISVSRNHAEIKLIDGNFFISDNKSKFGTLISVGIDYLILPNKTLSIQTRKHFFTFHMKRDFWSTVMCYKPKNFYFKDYSEFFFPDVEENKDIEKKIDDDRLILDKTAEIKEKSILILRENRNFMDTSIKSEDKIVIDKKESEKYPNQNLDYKIPFNSNSVLARRNSYTNSVISDPKNFTFFKISSQEINQDEFDKNIKKIPIKRKKFSAMNLRSNKINQPTNVLPRKLNKTRFESNPQIHFNININLNEQANINNKIESNQGGSINNIKRLVNDLISIKINENAIKENKANEKELNQIEEEENKKKILNDSNEIHLKNNSEIQC